MTQLITVDPEIHGGTPVFSGTRVPVKTLFHASCLAKTCLAVLQRSSLDTRPPRYKEAAGQGSRTARLLALAAAKFDVLLMMDGNLEFQQNLATLPVAVLVVEAASNRMEHLARRSRLPS